MYTLPKKGFREPLPPDNTNQLLVQANTSTWYGHPKTGRLEILEVPDEEGRRYTGESTAGTTTSKPKPIMGQKTNPQTSQAWELLQEGARPRDVVSKFPSIARQIMQMCISLLSREGETSCLMIYGLKGVGKTYAITKTLNALKAE